MNGISNIGDRLAQVNGRLSQIEANLVEHPDDITLKLSLGSTIKHRAELEQQFQVEAAKSGVRVCT